MKKYPSSTYFLFFTLLILSSCAPAGNTGTTYGILSGLVHGIVFPFALLSKLYTDEYALYAVNNSGVLYWAGFVIGLVVFWGGGIYSRR